MESLIIGSSVRQYGFYPLRPKACVSSSVRITTGRPATFLFARVQLDRNRPDREWWTFVVAIEE